MSKKPTTHATKPATTSKPDPTATGMLAAVATSNAKAAEYQPAATVQAARSAEAPEPAPEPTAAAAPVPAPKPLALTGLYRKAIILHPERSLKDHEAALKAEGVEIRASTLSTIRSDTLNTIAILKSVGKWKD